MLFISPVFSIPLGGNHIGQFHNYSLECTGCLLEGDYYCMP